MVKVIKGDILEVTDGLILHQVNCQGEMRSGLAKQIREKYPIVYEQYKQLCDGSMDPHDLLGEVQFIQVSPTLIIGNLFGQEEYGYDGRCYTDYYAFETALEAIKYPFNDIPIALPYRIGCARGGGDWEIVSKIINKVLGDCEVTLYGRPTKI